MDKEVKALDVEPLRIRRFEVGDLVFAKLKGYPPWPSKINQIESIISGGKEKTRYNVYFYGSHQSSILRSSSLFHYETYAKAIVEKWGPKPKFHDALKELEREMLDKMTYLQQLRSSTPESWCPGFSNACEGLVNEMDGKKQTTKSKSHSKQRSLLKKSYPEVHNVEDESQDESRKLGYEVVYVERIPFPDTPESLIILSLNFNKEWVRKESQRLKEEARMMNCYVSIKPLPKNYAHLVKEEAPISDEPMDVEPTEPSQIEDVKDHHLLRGRESPNTPKQVHSVNGNAFVKDQSDSDSEDAVETCPVCRLCFCSQSDLKNHEKTVHGTVLTAESLFDRLITNNAQSTESRHQKNESNELTGSTYFVKEGYPLDSLIKNS